MQEQIIWDALKKVLDPEYPISVVDMGLVRGVEIENEEVTIKLTFTSTGCPCMDWIQADIEKQLKNDLGIEKLTIEVVWDQPWTANDMTENAKETMRNLYITTKS
jgi:metal-sulfur cluster biosynthetic enzyme